MKSTCVSTSQRTTPLSCRRARAAGSVAVAPADLRGRLPVGAGRCRPVKSFEPRMSDEPTPYESTGTPAASNSRDLSAVKPPEATIRTRSNPSRRAPRARSDEPLVDARRLEVAHLAPRASGRRATRTCRAARPRARSPSARATSSAVRTESFSKSTSTTTFMSGGAHSANFVAASDGVAAVGRDQRVRHRAEAAAAPPRRLLVGRDADLGARRPGPRRTPRSRRPSGRGDGRGAPA